MIEGLKPYAEYKESGLPWLNTVPKHWDMAPNRALMRDQRQVVGSRASDYTLLSLTLRGVIARDMVNPKGKFPAQFNTYKVVKPDDFVFFPQYKNRTYALQTIRRQFEHVLVKAELRKDRMGRNRTIYSLRHSALMYRFLRGDKVDIFMLARNALTSVSQLERFYLSHAASRDKIESLHSFR